MYVEAAARLFIDGFWQEGGRLAFPGCHVLDNVFDNHGVVGHDGHIRQLYLDLHLAGAAHLVVVVFYLDAPVFHLHADAASKVVAHILGRGDVVAAVGHLVAVVAGRVQSAVPVRLSGVDAVSALFGRNLIAGGVEQIKFKLGSDHHLVSDAGLFHVIHGAQAHIFRVLVKGGVFSLTDDTDIAAHGQCGHIRKGVYIGGIRVWQKDHVALLNRSVPVVGTVEADPVDEDILIEPLHRYGDVAPASVDVGHFEVDHADLLLLTQFPDFCTFLHKHIPFCMIPVRSGRDARKTDIFG